MRKLSIFSLILILPMLFACVESSDHDMNEQFKMKAEVTAVGEKIEVEVIESEYTEGPYWIITSENTVFINSKGNEMKREDIKVGDTVIITYNGQVMMSYPPQVVALKIEKV